MNVYTATATANKPRTATVAAFGVCIAATIVLTVRTLRLALAGPFVPPYQSSQYWEFYAKPHIFTSHGLVRGS